ncbi:MAG: YebC/PmpR family DNA-binding transcriptional regulator [Verrucomicrobiota bacterium]
MGRAFEYRRKSKEARWDKMSKVFPKLAKSITIAVKEGGGPDPESNSKLRLAIANAKAENMPKDNVDKAIARATGKDAAEIVEIHYEGKGPHGSMLWVECAADNTNRTVASLKTILNKNGGEMVNSGALSFLFTRKAVVEFQTTSEMDLEEVELELIDHGLEDFVEHQGLVTVTGEFTAFGALTEAVEKLGITTTKTSLKMLPTSPIELSEAQMEEVESLIDKLEDDEDVQAVYTNIA